MPRSMGVAPMNQSSYEKKGCWAQNAEYRETSREAAGYLMNYDPKVPVHKYIRGLIDESLAPVPPGPGRS